MKTFYYLYEIHNITKGKTYIGQHCTYDMYDNYLSSCNDLKYDIKNGDKYVKNILMYFDNIYDLGNAEYEEIKKRNAVKDPLYYNKNNGTYFNIYFGNKRPEHSKKLKGKKVPSRGRKGKENAFFGKHHTKEVREKISSSKKGGKVWNEGISIRWIKKNNLQKMVHPNKLDEYIKKGWVVGRLPFKKS